MAGTASLRLASQDKPETTTIIELDDDPVDRSREEKTIAGMPPFPDTKILFENYDKIKPGVNGHEFKDFTALSLCGYVVGKTKGLSRDERRDLLTAFMTRPLHSKIMEIFGDEYGDPSSVKRLIKVANIIANNCKLRKRRGDGESFEVAIADWEDDLEFLRTYFYQPMSKGRNPRDWPDTEI